MTILNDMRAALVKAKRPQGWRIGGPAMRALLTDAHREGITTPKGLPVTILGLAYVETDQFKGWELIEAARPGAEAAAFTVDLCPGDKLPCYVGMGTDDAHHRCGTSQCGKGKA